MSAKLRLGRWSCGATIAAALTGCASAPPPPTYDLSAPQQKVRSSYRVPGLLIVAQPSAVQVLSTDRILVKDRLGAISFLPNGQWADQLPDLVQARLIQTFENASRLTAVSRPGDRVDPDFQLNTEIRAFQIEAATNEAVVEITVKAVNDDNGRITDGRIFTARVPVAAIDAANAAQALDQALSVVLLEIVRWAGAGPGAPATARKAPPTAG